MKTIGNLLLVVGLIFGSLSAATAYLAPVDAADLRGIELSEGAGADETTEEERQTLLERYRAGEITAEQYAAQVAAQRPVVPKGTELDQQAIDTLRDENVRYVETKSFDLGRWPYAWVFGLSAAGLLAGSLLVRFGTRAEISRRKLAPKHTGEMAPAAAAVAPTDPRAVVESIRGVIDTLRNDLPKKDSDEDRLREILLHLGALQGDQIPRFIEARPQLIAEMGLGGYAEVMDRFAALERKINRAWSAAADDHLPEATSSLGDAAALAPGVLEKL